MSETTVAPLSRPVGVLGVSRILLRWSPLVAPLIALSFYLAVAQTKDIQPEYTASVSVLVIGPNEIQVSDPDTGEIFLEDVNPLNNLGGSLPTVARITVIALRDSVADRLASEGLATAVSISNGTRSPIISIEVLDEDRELAARSADRLVELIVEDLDFRQDAVGAPDADRVFAESISQSTVGGPDYGGRNRVRIAIAVVGLTLSVALAFVLEGLMQLWRRRKKPETAPQPSFYGELPAGRPELVWAPTETPNTMMITELFRVESVRLVSALHLLTGSRAVAEKIAEETLPIATESWDQPRPGSPKVWLYREAFGRASLSARDFDELTPSTGDDEQPDQISDRLWAATRGLSFDARSIVALTYVAELPVSEVAAIVGVSEDLVMRNLAAASESLRTSTSGAAPAASAADNVTDEVGSGGSADGNLSDDDLGVAVADESADDGDPDSDHPNGQAQQDAKGGGRASRFVGRNGKDGGWIRRVD